MATGTTYQHVGERVAELIKSKGLTQVRVAKEMHEQLGLKEATARTYISYICNGLAKIEKQRNRERLTTLLDYLGVPAADPLRAQVKNARTYFSASEISPVEKLVDEDHFLPKAKAYFKGELQRKDTSENLTKEQEAYLNWQRFVWGCESLTIALREEMQAIYQQGVPAAQAFKRIENIVNLVRRMSPEGSSAQFTLDGQLGDILKLSEKQKSELRSRAIDDMGITFW